MTPRPNLPAGLVSVQDLVLALYVPGPILVRLARAKHVRLLAVDRVVAHEQGLLAHAQRDPAHVLDEQHDEGRPHEVPPNHEHGAGELVAQLDAVAGDRATGVGQPEGGAPVDRGPQARAEAADEAGDHVRVRDAQRVVKVALEKGGFADNVHGQPGDGAGPDAQEDGAPACDDAGRGGDGHEARDHAVDGADDGGLLVVEHVAQHPRQQGHGGAQVGVEHGDAGVRRGGVGITAVEAVPADPEDARTNEHDENVVGAGVLAVLSEARADPVGPYEARRARGQVDDVSTGIVDRSQIVEEAAAPEGVCADNVAEGKPEGHEEHPRIKIHAAEKRAGDEHQSNSREYELEIHHGREGKFLPDTDGWEVGRLEHGVDADDGVGLAHEGQHVLAKSSLVAPKNPADENGGEGVEGHEGAVDGPLLFHEAGVQDGQAWHGLEGDERGGRELPRIVTCEKVRLSANVMGCLFHQRKQLGPTKLGLYFPRFRI